MCELNGLNGLSVLCVHSAAAERAYRQRRHSRPPFPLPLLTPRMPELLLQHYEALRNIEKRDAFLGLLMPLKPQCSHVTNS